MKYFFKKLSKKIFSNEISSSFDTYNTESSNITNPIIYSGVKTEISKTINQYLQFTHVSLSDTSSSSSQIYATLNLNNILLQLSGDQDKNIQARGTFMYKNVLTKFNTVLSRSKDIFSQIEIDIKNRMNNLCLKMIQPAIKGSSIIYIGNFMQQFGKLSLGCELIGVDNYFGMSFVGRCDTISSTTSVSLQQFNTLSVDYYKKINEMSQIGFKFNKSKYISSYGLGVRIHSRKGEVIGSIDNNRVVSLIYNDRLSEGLSLSINCQMSKEKISYGYGFTYEF